MIRKSEIDSDNQLGVNDKIWNLDDIMKYFEEFIGNEYSAAEVVRRIKSEDRFFNKLGFRDRMLTFRMYLIDDLGIKDIPMSAYRRVKR